MDLTVLFTHLKIILLQYFQFLIFSFNNNKFNLNRPVVFFEYELRLNGIFLKILTILVTQFCTQRHGLTNKAQDPMNLGLEHNL